ncbi:MAG: cadherin-like domain-containing protein [Sphingomonas sp.]|uniref:cadherin-like domain-containing protein n=1 Tax=Sphingomonas sp. TaxID=28214 RepID=UPI0025D21D39|nr:cadherin-like domain-containing protein [Sphingomonas sp.]MBY0283700.1 cadherin-like domain-containing protein [Sphingomonas sp.]
MAVTITGTRTQQFAPGGDTDGDGVFDPGELVRVILRIVNSGTTDATGVSASDPFNGTVLNPGTVRITPIAVNDAFNITGNVPITFTAAQLLGNDLDPLGNTATLQVTAVSGATNGSIVNNGNGTFTFTPTTGLDVGQSASFQYTITDAEGLTNVTGFNGVVTLNITDVVWHVDSAYAGANGVSDGSFLRPFTSLTELNGVTGDGTTNDDVDAANEAIFINNRGTNYAAGITLEAGQRLFGDGASVSANGTALGVSGSNSTINFSGNGITLASNNTISGISLNGTAAGGTGITDSGASVGTLNISGTTISGTGRALAIQNGGALNAAFDALSSNGSSTQGVIITGGATGTLSATGGTIGNATGSGFQIGTSGAAGSGGSVAVTYGGTIANATGAAVEVQNHTANAITFSGSIIDSAGGTTSQIIVNGNTGGSVTFSNSLNLQTTSAAAVNLTNNTGATINFNTSGNGLDIVTSGGQGFVATGGGTVNVTGAGNTVASLSGTGVNLANTTIGGSGVRFDSVATTGASSGIILNNTGSGVFTVSGTGSVASGGTILNSTSNGISLNNTGPVSLTNMVVTGSGADGINGTTVNGLTLSGVRVLNNGNAAGERGVYINGLNGTATITGSTFSGNADHNVNLINNAGTLNLTVTTSTFSNSNNATTGNDGLLLESNGTATTTASITGSTFDNNRGDHFQFATNGTGGAGGSQNNLTFSGNTLTTSNAANILGGGVTISPSGGDDLVAAINNNTITGTVSGAAINLVGVSTVSGGNIQATIQGNTIGTAGVANSGTSGGAFGINAEVNGNGIVTTLINNNIVREVSGNFGIAATARAGTGTGGTLNATITNNTVTATATAGLINGINVTAGVSTGGDRETLNAQISGNTINAGLSTNIRVRALSNTTAGGLATFNLRGYTGGATDTAAVGTYVSGQNGGTTASAATLANNTASFNNTPGGAAPTLPGTPASPLLAVVQLPQPGAGDFGISSTSSPLPFGPIQIASGSIADRFGLFGDGPTNNHISVQIDGNGNIIGQTLDPNAFDVPADPAAVAAPEAAAPSAPTSFDLTPIVATETGILTQAALDAVVAAAIERWVAAGVTDAQLAALQAVRFDIADLPGIYLGSSSANGIQLDSDGAGFGWFIDGTPGDDVEFGGTGTALTGLNGIAATRIDLLTVVLHELGHAIGLEDTYLSTNSSNLLYGYINPGERRLPAAGQANGAVPGSVTGEAFALGATAIGTLAAGRAVEIIFDSTINALTNQVITNPTSASVISGTNFATVNSNTQTLTLDTLTLGGSVFIDTNRDGIQNNGEVGPSGVALALFADTNGNNVFDLGIDTSITTSATGANGVYSFGSLAPGNYIVRVESSALTAGGALVGRASTISGGDPDNNIANDSNGGLVTLNTVTSQAITLAYNTEPTAGTGNDTNNTLGFGFITPSVAGPDLGTVSENTTTAISILINDTDPVLGAPSINQINGVTLTAGQSTTLASGAIVTRNADNTLTYNPNGQFNYLVSAATAAATGAVNGSVVDTFGYTLVGGGSATVSVTVNGVDGPGDQLRGNAGNNTLTGTNGVDFFNLSQGGNDTVSGGASNDAFYFGAAFAAGDIVDGGTGTNDQVGLQGNYSYNFAANQLTNVEVIALLSSTVNTYGGGSGTPYNYSLVMNDGNVAAGQELVVFAGGLAVGENFQLNASSETDGSYRVYAGRGADTIATGAGNDGIYFGPAAFDPNTDTVNGGAGTNDQVALDGNYTTTIFGVNFQNVEVLALLRGVTGDLANYNLTFVDAVVGAGQTFTVFALPVETNLTLNASAETDGNYIITGGQANDTITTGAGNDRIFGGLGADVLTGGAGADTFLYNGVSESTGATFDRIVGFVSGQDRFDVTSTITSIGATVGAGNLSTASFNTDLAAVIGAGQLAVGQAVLFTATGGTFAGSTFLIVDGDGVAGYQANSDYVFLLSTPPASLTVADFI